MLKPAPITTSFLFSTLLLYQYAPYILQKTDWESFWLIAISVTSFMIAIIGYGYSCATAILNSDRGPAHLFLYTALGAIFVTITLGTYYVHESFPVLREHLFSLVILTTAGLWLLFTWAINRLRISFEGGPLEE